MLSLPGYERVLLFDQDLRHRVYRGIDRHDGAAVILKTTASDAPQPRALERLRLEHAILRDLHACDGAGVPRPRALLPRGPSLVLVLDDVGGQRLDALLRAAPLSIERFFAIALPLVDVLDHVHRGRIVHRDLRPRNVIVNLASGELQLVEFGAASRLLREPSLPLPPEQLDGTLAYIAPEQTGRMNRAVDYRADFYALGATFCEMLTGEAPFDARDALELVHCHLARVPVPAIERRPDIPQSLSDIVAKLLAKLAEDRYQSAAGLRADLQRCQREWRAAGRVEPFGLGSDDVSDRFQPTQRLYGREAEAATLLAAFERVASSGRPELMLVAGQAGIGKSMLVGELHQAIVAQRGDFVDGKVDQYRRDLPHAALAEALRGLVQPLLADTDARLAASRRRIVDALGDNAQVIVELVPQLHLIIGAQPPPPDLPADRAQHRLQRSVRQFISVFARVEHPLVLFLDDLQWADAASLELLAQLVGDPQTQHLLVLGAYRDNEVGTAHPLTGLRAALDSRAVPNATVTLAPLQPAQITRMLADTLHCGLAQVAELAQVVHAKTRGNPFFTCQFVTMLHSDGLIGFDRAQRRWVWQAQQIAARNFTDNVVELMLAEMMRLPPATRDALALAGLLGHRFTRATLALVSEQPFADTEEALRPALEVGLLARSPSAYRFLHDRVQEAACELTPPAARAARHWRIACRLHQGLSASELDERSFDIAEHFNAGATDPSAADDLPRRQAAARLNLRAGAKAQAAVAYAAAARHYRAGIALLAPTGWDDDYPLAFALHLGRAKCAWLAGEFDAAAAWIDELLARARDDLDWAEGAHVAIALNVSRHDIDTACRVALACLRRLGLELPARPTRDHVREAYDEHLALLDGRPIESLAELPRMTDACQVAALRVLASLHSVTFFTNRDLWALLTTRMVILTQRHGHTDASVSGYAVFGNMIGMYFLERRNAYRYGELAFELTRHHGTPHDVAMVQYHRGLIGTWVRPLREVQALEREALRGLTECGDRIASCVCAQRLLMDGIMHGDPLAELASRADEYLAMATQANFAQSIDLLTIRRQHIRSLRGLTQRLGSLDDASFDEAVFAARSLPGSAPIFACWFHLARLAVLCVAGDDDAGWAAARAAEPLLGAVAGLFATHEYHVYDALCTAGRFGRLGEDERQPAHERLLAHERQLREWAELNPATFAHARLLVTAEIARIDGRALDAMALYEQALAAARAHGYAQFEALANERAASFYRASGVVPVADAYLLAARDAYARWGADAKLRQIDAAHPRLARPRERRAEGDDVTQLDALAIVKAARAISGPMLPDQLLRELLTLVLQQAGAQFGALLLVHDDALALAATARGDGPRIEVALQGGAPADAAPGWFANSIATYVWRSAERVLLDDARTPNRFSADPALAGGSARSLLALPIVRQAAVIGVLYLEHRGVAGAFSRASVAVVEQLAAQAAISLESARLYAELAEQRRTLEAQVAARTLDLQRSGAVLQAMLDGMPALVALKGLDGRYLMHNRRYAEQFGRAGASLLGLRAADLMPVAFAQRSQQQDSHVIATGAGLSAEEEVAVLDGLRTFQIHKFPVRDAGGAVYAVGSIAIDVTALKNAQVDAEAAAQAKSQFLANMSHEIRTPMNAILGMAHLALRSGLNAQQHNYVQKVEHSARALLGLINDILDFSKIEAGKLDLETRAFDLREVLDNLASVIGQEAAEKGLELLFDCAPDVPVALVGDPLRLGQVLINLGNNAVKFTERGEIAVRIEVAERDAGGVLLRFTMRDTGVGMSDEQRERLFRPFMQADASTSRRYGGTGLGLAISGQLVRLLGGFIDVRSAPGAGSTFHFTAHLGLPAAAAAPAASVAPEAKRVLVVDDNASAREILLARLRQFGWRAEAAEDGWAAMREVALAGTDPFDLILLDWQMPGVDGAECAQKLAQAQHGERPIVMMSSAFARDTLMKRLAALRVTPSGVLAKPFSASTLFDACIAALGGGSRADARGLRRDERAAPQPMQLHGARVLLVEDNLVNQELALELLRDAGMLVTVAGHGGEALAMLDRKAFDLVLMDCQMPMMDGYEATRAIRARPEWAGLPIIALTANAMASDQRKALAAGMNDHIAKPIDVGTMFGTIARWLVPAGATAPAAAAATRCAVAPAVDPLMLPGIDSAIGLASTAGNEKLYAGLLRRFRDAQRGFPEAFRAARARGDTVGATRLAHDLRAIAGTLGAKALERETQALEAACRDELDDAAIEALMAAAARELAPVMTGLATLG